MHPADATITESHVEAVVPEDLGLLGHEWDRGGDKHLALEGGGNRTSDSDWDVLA